MISPINLMQRLGSGGRLVAFFKTVCVYFLVAGGEGGEGAAAAVLAKVAPVLCLALSVEAQRRATPPHQRQRRQYARRVGAGLALSAAGDALLALSARLEPGMLVFGLAHVAYLAAFGRRGGWALGAAALLALGAAGAGCALGGGAPVALYAALLAAMCWRAWARGGAAAAGAALFVLSDCLLAVDHFVRPLPQRRLLVMLTYYLAQLAIALSALRPLPPLPAAAH